MKKILLSILLFISGIAWADITPSTAWADVDPEATLTNVADKAGIATRSELSTAIVAATNNIDLSHYLPTSGGTLTGGLVLSGMYETVLINPYEVMNNIGTMNWNEIIPISWYRRALTNIARNASSIVYRPELETATNTVMEQVDLNTDSISSLQTSVSTNASKISSLETQTSVMYQLFSGSNVVLEVTNYNSQVGNSPKMSLLQLTESNTYTTVWTETNNLYKVANSVSNYTATTAANIIDYANTAYAPIAWSGVYSGTGAAAPSNQTWITTPTLVLAGGLEFQQTVTSSGNLFFLVDNGLNTVATNKYGFMQLSAADGSPLITIAKTDSYYVGCDPTNITVNGTTVTIEIPVISTDHPYVRYVQTLTRGVTPEWLYEEDSIPGITINWSGSSGAWVCTIETSATSGFFAFEVLQQGSTKIEFGGMVDVNTNGILCTDGEHAIRPVYNNGTITWEVIE